ncbi:MAG: PASTA domain-containing protein [Clostridia bacterium]|nr:PASTA domain-containing protein [Clostridia bacterium]
MSKGINIRMQRRSLVVLIVLVFIGFPVLIFRLVNLQIVQGEYLQKMASEQQLTDTKINPKRGTIYDRNMNILAQSASVWTVVLEPAYIDTDQKRELICSGMSEILNIDKEKLLELSKKKSCYNIIKKKVESDIKDKIIEFKNNNKITTGIRLIEDYKRYYPLKNFLAAVLGFVGADSQGLAGIESYYDKELSGEPGRILTARNAIGKEMPFEYEQLVNPKPGHNLKLCIDENIQKFLEIALEEGVRTHNVKNRATGIVMDVNTGEILGMAVKQDFDPNEPFEIYNSEISEQINSLPEEERQKARSEALSQQWRNKAISDVYYPGSVFKMITAAMGFELDVVNEKSSFNCTGSIKPIENARAIGCHKRKGHGMQNFVEALCHSCNPAFITLGLRIGAKNFFDFYKSFGLHNKTNIDLPGESTDLFFNADGSMSSIDLCVASMGQNFGITPIQMITAAAAIANGGKIIQPHIVKEILDENNNIIKKFDVVTKRQAVSEQTAKRVTQMLYENATHGAAKNAYIPGYRVAGKTGTSEKIGLSTKGHKDYISSFCGFAPADNPKLAMLVAFDTPKGGQYYGSIVAAPVFARAMQDILPYFGIEKVYTEEELEKIDTVVPDLLGKNINEAKNIINSLGLKYTVLGTGDKVISQIPDPLNHVPKESTLVLHTDSTSSSEVKVPKFTGYSVQDVKFIASKHGLNINLSGIKLEKSGAISSTQSVPENTVVPKGTVITIGFVHSDSSGD